MAEVDRSVQGLDPVEHVAGRVHAAFSRMLTALTGFGLPTPTELQRRCGVDVSLSSRLLTALRLEDAMGAMARMPKSRGLRMVIQAAAKGQAPLRLVREAEQAVDELDALTRSLGGQAELDAMLAGRIPEARERFDLRNRQAVFRAMSNLKGIAADALLSSHLIHPGESPDRHDAANIMGPVGLYRFRADGQVRVSTGRSPGSPTPTPGLATTLDGDPLDAEPWSSALKDFCKPTPPMIRCINRPPWVHRILDSEALGRQAASTIFFGELQRSCCPSRSTPERPYTGLSEIIDIPTKLIVLDMFVHEDLWTDHRPVVLAFDSVMGIANPNDPGYEFCRWHTSHRIEELGRGASEISIPEVRRYPQMLDHACERIGWDLTRFRGYRCRIGYPIYASQIGIGFYLPSERLMPE